jgi:pterin-4a-carbinolamine dehydratase
MNSKITNLFTNKNILNIKNFNIIKIQKTLNFSFCETEIFGNFISRKSGQKCCIYGQNGKPLKKETVEKYLENLKITNFQEIQNLRNLSDFEKNLKLINWAPNENYTSISRIFYFKNVFYLMDFIKEIYNLDYTSDLQVIPNIQVYKKELLKIELTTPDLKGLSMKDLNLAFAINSLNYEKYLLYPIEKEDNYKKEIRGINLYQSKIKEEKEQRTKLKNKYDSLVYEDKEGYKKNINKKYNNNNNNNSNINSNFSINEIDNSIIKDDINSNTSGSSCCAPGSDVCACKQASKYLL